MRGTQRARADAEAAGGGQAGQAVERVGVVALAGGDEQPALAALREQRQPFDVGHEVRAVDRGGQLAGGGGFGAGVEGPDAAIFLTHIKRLRARIGDAAFGLGGEPQGADDLAAGGFGRRSLVGERDADLMDRAVLQHGKRIEARSGAQQAHPVSLARAAADRAERGERARAGVEAVEPQQGGGGIVAV